MINLPKNKCTGCGCCKSVCPFDAISMKYDKEGFVFPYIDKSKCKNCKICEKKCPVINNYNFNSNKFKRIVYAAYSKSRDIVNKSSSGGIFFELSKIIIENGGEVYGVKFDAKLGAYHVCVKELEYLHEIMGSKYLQSNAFLIFKDIKKSLIEKKTVLFSGTPCQVASLKNYLGKEYQNLITIDFICTGVPSKNVFWQYIKYIERKYRDKFVNIDFRNKHQSWYNYNVCIELSKRKIYESRFFNPLIILHYKHLSLRSSCFDCKFRNGDSPSDIQLGDFWNIDLVEPKIYNKLGTSAIIIKSEKGSNLFNRISNNIEYYKISEDKLASCNPSYLALKSDDVLRNDFFSDFSMAKNKINIIKRYSKYSLLERVKIKKRLLVRKIKQK
ncbi:MAG: Coenzyme F420 hydrogenase/dehydrogenase, beta subunit C-terminal domain [Bacilli bacterium]